MTAQDTNFVDRTQQTLGRIIQKPTLSEKHLSRPPFRFLHDIVTQLIKKTGFFTGLFPAELLDAKAFNDKNDKIKFLQLLIDCTQIVAGKKIPVKASKIMAGQEPENTNLLLQEVAHCILNKMSSDDAVAQIKTGKGKKSKEDSKENQKRESRKERKEEEKEGKEGKPLKEKPDQSKERRKRDESKNKESRRDKEKEREGKRQERDRSERKSRDKSEKRKETEEERRIRKEKERDERRKEKKREKEGERKGKEGERPTRPPRPTSAKGDRRKAQPDVDNNGEKEEEDLNKTQIIRPASTVRARPSSARPAKRVKQPQEPIPDQAQTVVNPNVIRDDDEEEDDLVLEVEAPIEGDRENALTHSNEAENHGALVRDILDEKNTNTRKQEKSYNVISEADQEKIKKQMAQLKTEIQTIARTTAPIGRVLDFIQEDMDAMQTEYDHWTNELEDNLAKLNHKKSKNVDDLKVLVDDLSAIELSISQKRADIVATKQTILLNQQDIEKQMKMVFSS